MADVVKLRPAEDPNEVLTRAAADDVYAEVIVIGWTKEGTAQMRSTLGLEGGDILLLVEIAKKILLEELIE
jgi:hypothetical protein